MATNILTIRNHNSELDCKKIHDSLSSSSQLVPFLASLTQLQRQQIRETYKSMYNEDLVDLLQKYESGFSAMNFSGFSLWMLDPHDRDAVVAREALEQDAPDFGVIAEILLGRKSSHVLLIKQAYLKRFRRQLDQDIINLDPPHPFQKILLALSASHNAHHADVNEHISKCDARRLYEIGEGGSGAIGGVVLEILSKRSIPQLTMTFSNYKRIYGHDYTKSLKGDKCGEFGKALKVVVKCICNPAKYYAKALHTSIKGPRNEKGTLARVLASRAEIDIDDIKRAFKEKYNEELVDVICEDIPAGDQRDFLIALVTRNSAPGKGTSANFIGSKTC